MNQFVDFITNHWVLSTAFLLVFLAFSLLELFRHRLGIPEVSPEALVQWMNHQGAVVLDIRGDAAFAEGHILGSEHVPASHWENKMARLNQWMEKPVIVICAMGNDAPKIGVKLKEKGFKQILVLKGGIQAWKMAGLPLAKS